MHAEPPAADVVTSNDTPDLPVPAPRVLLVVLTWNERDDTLACVESILALDYPRFRVLVVDNASIDGTEAALRERFGTRIDTLRNDTNLLYAGGMNVGLESARQEGAEYVLLLNNDIVLDAACSDRPIMRAAWYERRGPAREVLVLGDMPTPEPGAGEVRIRLAFSGLNPGDVKKRSGWQGLGYASSDFAIERIIASREDAITESGKICP